MGIGCGGEGSCGLGVWGLVDIFGFQKENLLRLLHQRRTIGGVLVLVTRSKRVNE